MPDERKYCVYRHTSPSGKVYIGITHQPPKRRWCNGHGYRHNPYFTKAIHKYGWDNFIHEVLYSGLTKEEACAKEIELIQFHRSNNDNYGYNLSSGGEASTAGIKHSEEARRKMSESRRGENSPWYGKKLSEDHRRKMSEAHKGYKPTLEARRRCGERQMGEKNHNYGKHASEETRRKMSESHSLYAVVQMTITGEIIEMYPTTRVASEKMGCARTTISNACSGRRKTAMGYKWKYEQIQGGK